jgi:hypothetical protein
VNPHAVPLQVSVPFAGDAGHALHDVPHVASAVLLTHAPEHRCWPDAQTHEPAWQVLPPVHALPHPPQFALSVCSLTHALPQAVWPALQVKVHAPLTHAGTPLVGADVHALPQVPQLVVVVPDVSQPSRSGGVPALQSSSPALHVYAHVVPLHEGTPVLVSHTFVHVPQLVVDASEVSQPSVLGAVVVMQSAQPAAQPE